MLKKVLLGLGVIIVVLVALFIFQINKGRKLSPAGNVTLKNDGIAVTINYSRPSVRDRLIFGKEEDGALLPHGKYWRLGANEPTTIEVDQDFLFGSKKVGPGKYTIYAIPEAGKILLRLNADIKMWGTMIPEESTDVANVLLDMVANEKTEQFTITCEPVDNGVNVVFFWDTYYWELPILKQS